jgi:hypothetical protein
MLVLDYPRELLAINGRHPDFAVAKHAITIPPFHTGHLGFVPDSEVHIGLLAPYTQYGTHCEVLVTPYESGKHLARITCTMLDQRGVVKKLVDALFSLNVNILLLETSAIHHSRYHQVNLLFDWGTSEYDPTEKSSFSDQQRYHPYSTNFPIDLRCYVLLFETIVRYCLEDLALDHIAGLCLPSLYIRPVTSPSDLEPKDRIKIRRTIDILVPNKRSKKEREKAKKKFPGHAAVTLSKELEHVLRQRLDVDAESPLECLLISETQDRILRAFFPNPKEVGKIVHVGISHQDQPGAMSNLLTLVRIAGFNVLTGLLRQSDGITRMWEGLLRYEGTRKLEDRNSPGIYRWVADRLAYAARAAGEEAPAGLKRYDLRIGPPRYSSRGLLRSSGNDSSAPIPLLRALDQLLKTTRDGPDDVAERDYVAGQMEEFKKESELKFGEPPDWERERRLAEERKSSLHTANRSAADRKDLLKLYDLIEAGRFARIRPRIFLSYPFSASSKAQLVEDKLKEHFEFVRYQEGDSKIIVNEVIHRIESCDYFIGIWDPDRAKPASRGASDGKRSAPASGWPVSPWLPFEYGIAKTARKPTVLAHHNNLEKGVWSRISPEVAQPSYDDDEASTFEKVALPLIEQRCLQDWIP